jgi:predicted MFS family arabinose efflux permease
VQASSYKNLAVAVSIYFLTVNFTEMFLSIFFIESGMKVGDVVTILLITFLVIGLLPPLLLKFFKNFERLICSGISFTMLFYTVLIFVKNPLIIGLFYGLSSATFWPSFNLLQFRLSESNFRARTISLFSSVIPTVASIVGPAFGGIIIENFGFKQLFSLSLSLYFISLALSTRIRFKSEVYGLSLPKERKIFIFSLHLLFSA